MTREMMMIYLKIKVSSNWMNIVSFKMFDQQPHNNLLEEVVLP